ncbi:MAG: hypothetical protein U0263_09575 [Polyangiaceae bacterium]
MSPERAAEGYLEGFRRREAMGDRAGAFEDLRAVLFEMAPGEPAPAERLAGTLSVRGRTAAADEVLREHARASGERGRERAFPAACARRSRQATCRALGAAFDAHLEAEGESATVVLGGLFERAGLYELVAARSELALAELYGSERARARNALAELYAGPLASPDRAVDCWIDACISVPREPEARARLEQELDSTGDAAPLVSAFLSITLHGADSDRLRVVPSRWPSSPRPVCAIPASRSGRPSALSRWAREPSSTSQLGCALVQRHKIGASRSLRPTAARRIRSNGPASSRGSCAVVPSGMDQYLAVLAELAALDNRWQRALERAPRRAGRMEELERARSRPGAAPKVPNAIASPWRSRPCTARGVTSGVPWLCSSPWWEPREPTRPCALSCWCSRLVARKRLWARAIARPAAPMSSSVRAVMLAVAAEALASSGDVDAAREAAEQATRADPSQARPVGVLATIALARPPDREVAEALERAMGFIVPRAQLREALAVAHEKLGDPALALVFTQRWLTLRPGDPHAIRTLLGRVTESGDAQRIGDALSWLLSQPEPLSDLAPSLAAALLRLSELDPARGATMARRALDVLGPKSEELRSAVLAVADANQEPGLALALFERTLAVGAESSSRVSMLLELALRRRTVGDADGVARALAHAVAEALRGGGARAARRRATRAELRWRAVAARSASGGAREDRRRRRRDEDACVSRSRRGALGSRGGHPRGAPRVAQGERARPAARAATSGARPGELRRLLRSPEVPGTDGGGTGGVQRAARASWVWPRRRRSGQAKPAKRCASRWRRWSSMRRTPTCSPSQNARRAATISTLWRGCTRSSPTPRSAATASVRFTTGRRGSSSGGVKSRGRSTTRSAPSRRCPPKA